MDIYCKYLFPIMIAQFSYMNIDFIDFIPLTSKKGKKFLYFTKWLYV